MTSSQQLLNRCCSIPLSIALWIYSDQIGWQTIVTDVVCRACFVINCSGAKLSSFTLFAYCFMMLIPSAPFCFAGFVAA